MPEIAYSLRLWLALRPRSDTGWCTSCKAAVAPSPRIRHSTPMIKSELVTRLADQNPHRSKRNVDILVRAILDRIAQTLTEGDRVELSIFATPTLQARPGHNSRSGKAVVITSKANIRFKSSRAMQVRLNPVEVSPELTRVALRRAS